MMPIEELQALLENSFGGDQIELSSPMGDNNHFQLILVSEKFEGKSMVEQHQMVYQAMGDAMHEAVHAMAMKTYTPRQWEQRSGR